MNRHIYNFYSICPLLITKTLLIKQQTGNIMSLYVPLCVRWRLTKREQNETLWYTPGIPYTPIGILKTL